MDRRTYLAGCGIAAGGGFGGCLTLAGGGDRESDPSGDDADGSGGNDDSAGNGGVERELDALATVGTIGEGDTITSVRLTISLVSGVDDVDLERATLQFVQDDDATVLVHEAVAGPGDDNQFTTTPITAEDETNDVLTDSDDRYGVEIALQAETLTPDLEPMDAGERALATIATAGGGQTETRLRVPEPMPYAEVGGTVDL